MPEPVRFAVIGCGSLARVQHIPNLAASERTVLHTCCDVSEDALRVCRDDYGVEHTTADYREAIACADVEAVCVATTEKLRLPIIEAAAAAGKPIYVEKPVAASLEELYRIRDLIHDSGIPLCVGHNRRSAPAMQDAHRIFRRHMTAPQPCPWRYDREGPAGRPELAEDGTAGMSVRINDDWYSWKGWVFGPDHHQHGPLLFEMTHFTDLCNWFMDASPAEVVALEHGHLNHGVVIRYSSGEMATISMSANGTFGYPKELYEMFGNGGAVIVDHMLEVRTAGIAGAPARQPYPFLKDRHPHVGTQGGIEGWLAKKSAACAAAAAAQDPSLIFTAEPDKGHRRALERFADEIQGLGPVVCGIDAAVDATRVSFAAVRAVRQQRLVRMEEI